MKVILAGHKESKSILPASSWLVNKYFPKEFEFYWLNYGKYDGKLFRGKYIELDEEQLGGHSAWSSYLAGHLRSINDSRVILALDDYLITSELDTKLYKLLLDNMYGKTVCARLCDSTFYHDKEVEGSLVRIGNNRYTCTTQYCIWDRVALIGILEQVRGPWEFEIKGTQIFNGLGYKAIGTIPHALDYPDYSSMSARWIGIETKDNNKEDIKYLKEHGYI